MNKTTDNNSQVNDLNALLGCNLFNYDPSAENNKALPTIAVGILNPTEDMELGVPIILSQAGTNKVYAPKKGEKTSDVIKKAKKDGARVSDEKSALEEKNKGVDVKEVGLETDKDHEMEM